MRVEIKVLYVMRVETFSRACASGAVMVGSF